MTNRMVFRSNPRNPGAMALVGNYAVQQNTNDRSQDVLNTSMDSKFKPQHEVWTQAWVVQQQVEDARAAVLLKRDQSDAALDSATASVLNALEYTQGKDSPNIKQYIPGGTLAIIRVPFAKQLTQMEPYAEAIKRADDSVIPQKTREEFRAAYEDARANDADATATEKGVIEAQRARAALDEDWRKAYDEYHRAVEYVCGGDRRLISTWIKAWPEQGAGSSSSGSEEPEEGEEPAEG